MTIGATLKYLRMLMGLSQICVAQGLDMERTTYSKLETEKTMLRMDQASKIADFYGLKLNYLVLCLENEHFLKNSKTVRLVNAKKEKTT